MELIINKELDELFNILNSFHILVNYQYYKEQIEYRWNLKMDETIEKYALALKNNPDFDKAHLYIGANLKTESLFNNPQLQHECRDIEEYLNIQKEQSEDFLFSEVFRRLELNLDDDLESNLQEIDQMDVDSDIKWFYTFLIQKPKQHMNIFIDMMETYLPIYERLVIELHDDYQEFSQWLNLQLENNPIQFLQKYLDYHNLNSYNKITVNTSMLELISTQTTPDGAINIYLGTLLKQYVEDFENRDDVEYHTSVFKVMSDPTRFSILELLAKKPHYGQEIAEALNVSTATISYHVEYLFSSKLVTMERIDRKIYYTLNKDNLRMTSDFLNNHFML